jgi:hypothetical protein
VLWVDVLDSDAAAAAAAGGGDAAGWTAEAARGLAALRRAAPGRTGVVFSISGATAADTGEEEESGAKAVGGAESVAAAAAALAAAMPAYLPLPAEVGPSAAVDALVRGRELWRCTRGEI